MAEEVVASRYAEALIMLAHNENEVQRFEDDIEFIIQTIKLEPRLEKVLFHPFINKAQKLDLIEKIWKEHVHKTVFNFMKLLIDKRRINQLNAIYDEYVVQMNKVKGICIAKVETAVALEAVDAEKLKAQLEKVTALKLLIDNKVNPSIIGGLSVRIGDEVIDWRISRTLETLNEKLRENSLIKL
ncbi:MAG: ATP synthase F1 subunit delta [Candidatus Wallbacteria bacterium]